jgi:hypothetical protein
MSVLAIQTAFYCKVKEGTPMNTNGKLYIGIDPDLRLLNAAVVTVDSGGSKKARAVFIRRNKAAPGDVAVAEAARMACKLVADVIAYLVANEEMQQREIITVVESQNVQYTGHTNSANKQSVLQAAQVAGCLMGVFSNLSDRLVLVQPNLWKGNVPKPIHHRRIYASLEIAEDKRELAKNVYPAFDEAPEAENPAIKWSEDKINPGDFLDINDSLGLALYGAVRQL